MTTIAYYKKCLIADKMYIHANSGDEDRKISISASKIYVSKCKKIAITNSGVISDPNVLEYWCNVISNAMKDTNAKQFIINMDEVQIPIDNAFLMTSVNIYSLEVKNKDIILVLLYDNEAYSYGTGKNYFKTAAKTNIPINKIISFVSSLDPYTSKEFDIVKI